jgi:hypothetical protein
MNRKMSALRPRLVGALALSGVLMAAAACGSSEPTVTESSTTTALDETPPPSVVPAGTVIPVPVTKPANPQPVDPGSLPESARPAGEFEGLQPAEKSCVDQTISATLKDDPSIESTEGKMQGLMGEAVVTCAGAARTATLFVTQMAKPEVGNPLSEPDKACFVAALTADPRGTATLMASFLAFNAQLIVKAAEPFDAKCAPARLVSPQFAELAKAFNQGGAGG